MLGAIILIVLLVIVVPVSIAIVGAVLAGVVGGALHADNVAKHEGSELLESNY